MKRILAILAALTGFFALLIYAARRFLVGWWLHLPPPRCRVRAERSISIPMRDGVSLVADRFYPTTPPPYATILIRTPYGRSTVTGVFGWLTEFCARRFAERGYAVVVQDVRGRFGSGGVFEPFIHEREDGQDTLDWLRAQPWTDRIGMWGSSYLGIVQWSVADDAALDALVPGITTSRIFDVIFPDGAFDLGLAIRWIGLLRGQYRYLTRPWLGLKILWDAERDLRRAARRLPVSEADNALTGGPETYYHEWLTDLLHNPDMRDRFALNIHEQVRAPVHLIGGWHDFFLRPLLLDYAALKAAGRQPYLTLGPWAHFSHIFLMLTMLAPGLRWFDAHLRRQPGKERSQPVHLYIMGLNQWRDYPDFPPPSTACTWYLGSDGRLNAEPAETPDDHLHYDPRRPTPIHGGAQFAPRAGAVNNRSLERRRDVLVYTTPPLAAPLEIIGAPQLALHLRTTSQDADVYARLCDVHPNGRSVNICDGFIRLNGDVGEMLPDGSRWLTFDLWSTAYRFAPGHRVRLILAGAAHPRWARHTGTDHPLTDTVMRPVDYTVYHVNGHMSALTLPVTSGAQSQQAVAESRRERQQQTVGDLAKADGLRWQRFAGRR